MSAQKVTTRTRARRAVRAVSRSFGVATSGLRVTPDFLIAGAQRCGTTSMMKTLGQHPAVRGAVLMKGVHYFDLHYSRGMSWYLGHFPTKASAERVRRRHGGFVTGESSPFYLFHPLAPERIARDLPEVRLLVLLRDPVERAYSAHAHELARGYEDLPFEQALAAEAGRLAGEVERMTQDPTYVSLRYQHNAYVTRGQYVDQLERLEKAVGRDRIHVVDSQDFFTDPEPVFDGVCDFLGLPAASGISFERHNARPRPGMSEPLRRQLDDHYRPYDERLAAWWRHTPSWRR